MSQRHTETHRTLAQGVTERLQQPRKCHQEDLHHTSTDRSPPPQGQAEAGVTSTVTQTRSAGSQTCMQLPWVQHSSSVPAQTQPSDSPHSFLFACWSSLMLTHTQHSHSSHRSSWAHQHSPFACLIRQRFVSSCYLYICFARPVSLCIDCLVFPLLP